MIVKGEKQVNAKSIMGVMSLVIQQGDSVNVVAQGEKGAEAIQAISEILETVFE